MKSVLSKAKPFLITAAVVVVTIIVYRKLVNPRLPEGSVARL